MHVVLLAYYSLAVVAASVVGGLVPDWVRLTHRRTEAAVSFVAGTMLGVAMLHLLPHALASAARGADPVGATTTLLWWVTAGFLAMFFIERYFCFHHHDVPESEGDHDHQDDAHACHDHGHSHTDHKPGLSWGGAAMGLALHSVLSGVALAASVRHTPPDVTLAGFGAFLAIALHKPLDAMTIALLMARQGWSPTARCVVNALFALAVPTGVAIFYLGVAPLGEANDARAAAALAFSAGVFLCVAMSDLLPELHFHHHDRLALSAALLAGLGVAEGARRFETHSHAKPAAADVMPAPVTAQPER